MSDVDALSSKLVALSADFAEQVGRRPSLGEILELLGWASHGIYPAPLTFTARLAGGKHYSALGESLVDELNDAIFVEAASFLAVMAETSSGQTLDPSELASALVPRLNNSKYSLADVVGEEIAELTFRSPTKKAVKSNIGDILALPAGGGGYCMASVVARNRFGTALGFLRGRFRVLRPVRGQLSAAIRFPVYTDDRLVATGAWKVVSHDAGLLSLFPAEPEIYHAPDLQVPGMDLGKFGAAEKASGDMRLIGIDEAREVGLLDGTYQQSYLGEFLEQFVDGLIDR